MTEVQGLEQSKKQEQQQANNSATTTKMGRKAQLLAGKKRSKPDSAATPVEGKAVRQKITPANDVEDRKPPAAVNADELTNALAATASAGYPTQQDSLVAPQRQPAAPPHNPHHSKQLDWRELLQTKSNKLAQEDHLRIVQFFTNDHFNPTPEVLYVKLKLHEERVIDAKTGEPVKETYYLELDYQAFTSKQSKKVKRY